MISFKIELDSKEKADNTYAILLRMTQNRIHKRIALSLSVGKAYYNPKGTLDKQNWIKGTHPEAIHLNRLINNKLVQARTIADTLNENGTPDLVAKQMKQIGNGLLCESFIQFGDNYVETFNDKQYNTYRGKKSSLNTFKDFLNGVRPEDRKNKRCKSKTSNEKKSRDLLFTELNLQLIKEYEGYLLKSGNSLNTVEKELSNLKTMINEAVKHGKMPFEKNPFLKFQLKRKPSNKARLTEQEIEKLQRLDLNQGSLIWHVRNSYLFSYYCAGIRCGDLLQIRWENVRDDRICYQMNKTGHRVDLPLSRQAKELLKLYHSESCKLSHFIFPFFSNSVDYSDNWFLKKEISNKNALLNKYLKEVAKLADINKPLSVHTARHSFADYARKKTNDIYSLSKMVMGHSSIRITQNYLSQLDKDSGDEAMKSIFN